MFSKIRVFRIITAIVIFISIAVFFLDIRNFVPAQFIRYLLAFQFFPALLTSIEVVGISLLGLLVIIVLTALVGRLYCSTICPLGVLQDIFSRISNLFRKKKLKFKFTKEKRIVRYSILALCLLGFHFLLNLLDPYSNFGRFLTYFVKPLVVAGNNTLYEHQVANFVYVKPIMYDIYVYIFSAIMLLGIVFLSMTRGRLFCNLICPVGSILGLISKISIFKLKINTNKCIGCHDCARNCKSACIDSKNHEIDMSTCVACYNCLKVCKHDAIGYSFSLKKSKKQSVDESRRDFFKTSSVVGMALFLPALAKANENKKEIKKNPVSPPGSQNYEHFLSHCTGCGLCMSQCPVGIIKPARLEYGLEGFLKPHLVFRQGLCEFDCTRCSEVCPNGAILPLKKEEKHLTKIGVAVFLKENCVVHKKHNDCGACAEHCPTGAIKMVPYDRDLVIPNVQAQYCIGCGACEHACPIEKKDAIYVTGMKVQVKAQKMVEEKLEDKESSGFAF